MNKAKQQQCSNRRQKLIKNATASELVFKKKLEVLGMRAIFQKGFIAKDGFCIVDFYLPKPFKLCIEIDGDYHNEPVQQWKDLRRTKYLKSRGFDVIRLTNEQAHNLSCAEIRTLIEERY